MGFIKRLLSAREYHRAGCLPAALYPDYDSDALIKEAATCFAFGRYRKALRYVNKAIISNPESAAAYSVRAAILRKLGKQAAAEPDAERAAFLSLRSREG